MSANKSSTVKKRLGQRMSIKKQITLQPASDGKLKHYGIAACSRQTPLQHSKKIEAKAMSDPRDLSATLYRTKLKRRRLEFVDHTQSDNPKQNADVSCLPELTDDKLFARVIEKQNQLKILKEHTMKVNEFLENITIWEEAFKAAVDDLSQKSGQSKEALLEGLKIPFDIASLID